MVSTFCLILLSISSAQAAPFIINYKRNTYPVNNQLRHNSYQVLNLNTDRTQRAQSLQANYRALKKLEIQEELYSVWSQAFSNLSKLRLRKLQSNIRTLKRKLRSFVNISHKDLRRGMRANLRQSIQRYAYQQYQKSIPNLSSKERSMLAKRLLKEMDVDKNGSLDYHELQHALIRDKPQGLNLIAPGETRTSR